ncbi:MAG: adenylate kinase [Beduini sp.]|uniref:adenylate kinase n=1 Tax=Beduini sp. TaxID=1922300 RepID=UPI0011CAF810
MIILISGSTHTGKTVLAQRLLEKYHYPYLSIDHLKMGLIRSGYTSLTPNSSDQELTDYLWPVVREIIKTNIENHQHIIIEGCYIPFDYKKDFDITYLSDIRFICLIFSETYIHSHYNEISRYENQIEKRWEEEAFNKQELIETNQYNFEMCQRHQCDYIMMKDKYEINLERLCEKWSRK